MELIILSISYKHIIVLGSLVLVAIMDHKNELVFSGPFLFNTLCVCARARLLVCVFSGLC